MPGIIEKALISAGRALRSFDDARKGAEVGKPRRPIFLGLWADAGKWTGGDWGNTDAAQQRARQNSWLFGAIKMISAEVSAANAQVKLFKGLDQEAEVIPNHPFLQILRRPNPHMSRSFLWRFTTDWLNLDGNAYWFLAPDEDNNLAEIWPLPSNQVEVFPGDEDRFIDYYEFTANGIITQIPAEYVCHFMYPNTHDVFRGASPLIAGMLPVDADNAMARWNGAFFGKNNVMPSAIINLSSGDGEAPFAQADLDRLKNELEAEYSAAERKTLVTNAVGGVETSLLGWSAKDMDFLAGRQFTKDEVYSIYGIPGGLLDKNATEANAQTADRIFKEKTIWPILTLLAEQITVQVIERFYGEDLEAAFEDIRPTNRQLELQEAAIAVGALTRNEYRARYFKLGPLADGTGVELYFPAQTQPAGGSPFDFGLPPAGGSPAPQLPPGTQPATPTQGNPEPAQPAPVEPAGLPPMKSLQPVAQTGVCIALFVPSARAQALALYPGLLPAGSDPTPPANMHMTLAYLGEKDQVQARPEEIAAVAREVFTGVSPMRARISGVGRFFTQEDDGSTAFYASVDVPGLPDVRRALIAALEEHGIAVSRRFEFTPHITLAYIPRAEPAPYIDLAGIDITFPFVTIAWGDEHHVIPLTADGKSFEENLHPRGEGGRFAESSSDDRPEDDFSMPDLDDGDDIDVPAAEGPAGAELDAARDEYQGELAKLKIQAQGEMEEAIANRDADGLAKARRKYLDDKAELQRGYFSRARFIATQAQAQKAYQVAAAQEDRFAIVAIRAELKRWQTKAMNHLKEGKSANPAFETDLIPADIAGQVRAGLEAAASPEDVKAVFGSIDLGTQIHRPDEGADALAAEIKAARELLEKALSEENDDADPAEL